MSAVQAPDRMWFSPGPETPFEAVALAASAGGLAALRQVLYGLPTDLPAVVLIAQHRSAESPSFLVRMFAQQTRLQVKEAEEGEEPRPATVYLAPAGRHLEIDLDGRFRVSRCERVRYVRPSADLLFESMAGRYQERAIAVVLTGTGSDGARGVQAVRQRGGFVVAQNRATSAHFDMPSAAIDTQMVDVVLPLDEIAFALTTLVCPKCTC